jgi:serine/threonine protein kinase/tetratricopeptide (TPR) repeat protein
VPSERPGGRAKAVFDEAAEIAAPERRAAYLERACGGDAELRRRVDGLLRALDDAGSFLEAPPDLTAAAAPATDPVGTLTVSSEAVGSAAGAAPTGTTTAGTEFGGPPESPRPRPPRPPVEGPGASVGPYKLLQKLGEGGMGTVYLAEQERPVRRKVALKVIKPGMDTEQVVTRFEAERQALAIMDHPNIARVYDAGATASGRPYFVMELVKGVPITQYCDTVHLTPGERLELFIPVCQAIQHAHLKGVIHRDVKPSNVLVTVQDGRPVPKVIDFGIAKAVEQKLTERTFVTQHGAVVGTLEYMSPEQAELAAMDVDTRADVYALGALLYELLTGTTPLGRGRLRQAALSEVLRRIREEEPPRPSTRLSESRDHLPSVAAVRRTEPARLTRLMRGDLDWIVMKALEKDRTRRYETAGGLARDIRRHLDGDPVDAGPPSATYRLRKYARKHRAALVTVGAFAAVLLIASAVSAALAVAASRARDAARKALGETRQQKARAEEALAQSEAARDFLVEAFRSPDPDQDGRSVKVVDMLGRAAETLDRGFTGDRKVRAALLDALGLTFTNLAVYDRAETVLERAIALRAAELGRDHPDTLRSRCNLANVYWYLDRMTESIALHEEVMRRRVATLGRDHPDTLQSGFDLASAYGEAGRLAAAIAMDEETLKLRESRLGRDHPDTLLSRNNLGSHYLSAGRTTEAIAMHEETLKRLEARFGPDHPDTLNSRHNLAAAYGAAGLTARPLELSEETLRRYEARLGPDHLSTLRTRINLAGDYLGAGRSAEGVARSEETLRLCESKLGPDHRITLASRVSLANVYLAVGRTEEAITMLEETLKLCDVRLGRDHPDTLKGRNSLAQAYLAAGRAAEAVTMLEATLKLMESKLGPDHPDTLYSRNNLATSYLDAGRTAEAIALHEAAVKLIESKLGPDHPCTLTSRGNLASAYSSVGHTGEAIAMNEAVLKSRTANLGPDHPHTLNSRNNLATSYLDAGRTAEAVALHEATLKLCESNLGPDHPNTLTSRNNLAEAYRAAGRTGDALRLHEGVLKARESKLGPDHPHTLLSRNNLALAFLACGQFGRAEPLLVATLDRERKVFGPEDARTAGTMSLLGLCLIGEAKWAEAERVVREDLAVREKRVPDGWMTFEARSLLGESFRGQARYAEAEPLIVSGYEGMRAREAKIPAAAKFRRVEAAERVVRLYEAWGKSDQAAGWKARLGLADLPADVFAPP